MFQYEYKYLQIFDQTFRNLPFLFNTCLFAKTGYFQFINTQNIVGGG